MHSANSWLKRHSKAIIAYTIGITLGVMLACLNNGIRQDLGYQKVMIEVNNNWAVISAIFILMLAMIVTGYFMGKMYDNKDI